MRIAADKETFNEQHRIFLQPGLPDLLDQVVGSLVVGDNNIYSIVIEIKIPYKREISTIIQSIDFLLYDKMYLSV